MEKLKEKIKKLVNVEIDFSVDGGTIGSNEKQKIELYKKYLDYHLSNVFYLPQNIPEEIIWNTDTAKHFINGIYPQNVDDKLSDIVNIKNLKERFSMLCKLIYNNNSSDMIFTLQKMFIRAWIEKKDINYQHIANIIDEISS